MLPDIFNIDGAWLDTEDWEFDVEVTGENGQPLDLTGSSLKLTFKALADGAEVSRHATAPGIGLTIKDGPNGVLTVTSAASAREWRCPDGIASLTFPQTLVGDVMRRAGAGLPYRGVQRVALKVLPGTTADAA